MVELLETIATGRQPRRRRQAVDAELGWIIASQGGDTVAFNRLVMHWQQTIFNLSLRMLGTPEDAADATQETFLRAFRSVRRFRLESRFSTWLFRIASNQCLTRIRRSSRQRQTSWEELEAGGQVGSEVVLAEDDQEAELFREERRAQVHDALAGLPADQRMVVELRYFQEATFEEISSILDTPTSTVKSRFYVALERLKLHFGEQGDRQ